MSDLVLVEKTPVGDDPPRAIGRLVINRPKVRNALTRATMQALRSGVDRLVRDAEVRVIVITGAGTGQEASFCAGADLKSVFAEDPDFLDKLDFYLDDFHGVIRAIWNAPKPVIARVDGGAVGFGCDLALACDLRIVSTRGYFQSSFTKIGLMPDGGGTATLTRLAGLGVATELVLLASKIEAHRAQELGLSTRVVEAEGLDAETDAIARTLADGAPIALAEAKKALKAALGISIDEILAREREGQLRCLRSNDVAEGVLAWAQRRSPRFTGT
jgi:enoyl-CoA hydratase/carnithine racemase